MNSHSEPTGVLVLVGAPIGDVTDASPALSRELGLADVVAAEDTRKLRDLARRLDVSVPGRVVSYFDGNEASRVQTLLDALAAGERVIVVSDAGMPGVSDPGYRIVVAAIEAGHRVTVAPGPSAVLAALAVSGLPTDRFCFEGFLPRKPGERRRRLAGLADEQRTMVFFEAPHRVGDFLADAATAFGGERPAAVCRELTKTYEEIVRGPLTELVEWASGEVRGEVTVVIQGAPAREVSPRDAAAQVLERLAAGERMKAAVSAVAETHGLPKSVVYEAALAAREESDDE